MVWANTSRFSRKNVVKWRRQALIAGLMIVFVRPSGRPPSGPVRQVESVRRRSPRRSDRRCHDIATRPAAGLFGSPAFLRIVSPLRAELALPPCRRESRRCSARSPPCRCRLQLALSSVFTSPSYSISPSSQITQGSGPIEFPPPPQLAGVGAHRG